MTYGFASNPDVPSIVLDDEDAAYTITRYLIEHGHRDIAVIGGMPDNMHTRKRLLGYQRALFEANILYNTELIRFANWDRQGKTAAKIVFFRHITLENEPNCLSYDTKWANERNKKES